MPRGWEFIIFGLWVLTHPLLPQLKILFCNYKCNGQGEGGFIASSLWVLTHAPVTSVKNIFKKIIVI